MKGSGAFLILVVGLLVLAAVLYGKTGCFGGFWNCTFGSMGTQGGSGAGLPKFYATPPTTQAPGTTVSFPIGSMK